MKRISTLLFLLTLGISSCNDGFLDRSPIDSLSPDNFFRNQDECRLVINGLYNPLSYNDYLLLDNYTDDLFNGESNGGNGISFLQGNIQAMDAYSKSRWVRNYKMVGLANLTEEGIKATSLTDAVKNSLLAETRFFRAYYYVDLISLWGDVPLILTKPSVSENLTPVRTPRTQVLDQVINDLEFAVQNLPVSYSSAEKGRVTKGAALAMKARILLFFGKYSEAAIEAKKCMDLNVYGLFSDLRGLFTEANEYNKEVIFDISYIRDLKPSGRNQNLIRQNMAEPTLSLVNEFEMADGKMINDPGSAFDPQNPGAGRDPRLNAFILMPGGVKDGIVNADGSPVIYIPKSATQETGIALRKSADYTDLQNNNSGINFIIFRYADVLLMFAEATNEVSGANSDVYNAVNLIRQRAKMPNLTVGLSKDDMRTKIRHERRVEFAGEGMRFFDMVRWGITAQVLSKNVEGYDRSALSDPKVSANWIFKSATVLKTNWNAAKGNLWPIPGEEILLNSKLAQNPGYN